MALKTSDQNSIAGFTDSVDNDTGVVVIRTLVLAYIGLMSLQSRTLVLVMLALLWH